MTQFLARLRYNDEALFEILGGRKAMIESPLLQELKKEWTEEGKREGKREGEIESLVTVLMRRFGTQAAALQTEIMAIADDTRLKDLIEHAATCRSLAAFRKKITSRVSRRLSSGRQDTVRTFYRRCPGFGSDPRRRLHDGNPVEHGA